ncbi:thiopeptide-type bacteriocin biosynthesis protein [Nonomuraea sp. NPDC050153]|uniref:thiopeptide-type bacteriocin biosynthesis protein n=1 Tax=Nonomuraea sp. NPDC050153 TaxID=3364359 RepID=UPI0037AE1F43
MKRSAGSAESEVLPGAALEVPAERWLQFGLTPIPERSGDLYAGLAALARRCVRDELVRDFFFMHKPPGMRVRFRPASAAPDLDLLLRERLDAWLGDGVISGWRPGVYEPETYLFGGPASMRSVHRVFTADSLAWLDYHRLRLAGHAPGPAWAMSLLLLRSLFATLRIDGWEGLGVWERVRRYRRLPSAALADPRLTRLTAALRAVWPSPAALAAKLSPEAAELAEDYRQVVLKEGERWFRDYFESGSAEMGPRAVASYLVIFHWNRANLPAPRQALITGALLAREEGDAR